MNKIVMMYDFFSEPGGIERIMLFQARILRQKGYNVTFAFAYVDEKLKEERLKGFDVIEYSPFLFKNETLQICSSIFRNNIIDKFKDFDIIICHSFPSSYLALRIKKKYNIPYVLHLHHPPQFLYNVNPDWAKSSFKRKFAFFIGKILGSFLKLLDSYCVKNADFYFVESQSVQRIIKETYGIVCQVLYPTFDDTFKIIKKPKLSNEFDIKGRFILASGRIIRQKRFDYLIEAFSKLKNKNKFKLLFAGKYEPQIRRELEEISGKFGVNPIFFGPVPIRELVKLYNLAELVVLTCPKEWFGLVTVEAMACGCLVVSWKDNFGPQEVINEGLNGYLAKPYDTNDLAKKISITLEKKWNKQKIRDSIKKFSEEAQSKVFIESLKKSFPKLF